MIIKKDAYVLDQQYQSMNYRYMKIPFIASYYSVMLVCRLFEVRRLVIMPG